VKVRVCKKARRRVLYHPTVMSPAKTVQPHPFDFYSKRPFSVAFVHVILQ